VWSLITAAAAGQTVVFSDSFDQGPDPLWANERGQWISVDGEYVAAQPSNSPPTLTTLPFSLSDFVVDVDIRQVSDGGIWLHVDDDAQNGVLLVTGGFVRTGTGFYFHTVQDGSFSAPQSVTQGLFAQGQDIHLRVIARGPTYDVYLNDAIVPVTSLTLPEPRTGRVGLYDFADPAQRFDNFILSGPCDPDINCDGSPDQGDVACMILAVAGDTSCICQDPDFNLDGSADQGDVAAMIGVVAGQPCP